MSIDERKNQLRIFVERIERLEEEKDALLQDIREVFAEAKSLGFDVPTIRKVIKLRKMDDNKRMETEQLLELYKKAVGL